MDRGGSSCAATLNVSRKKIGKKERLVSMCNIVKFVNKGFNRIVTLSLSIAMLDSCNDGKTGEPKKQEGKYFSDSQ
ncbi:MAG: hypothetical protein Q4G68_01160 [Planctomycetia bacterium]|nr:hypothetical protein [Planctomycetia bacterium]